MRITFLMAWVLGLVAFATSPATAQDEPVLDDAEIVEADPAISLTDDPRVLLDPVSEITTVVCPFKGTVEYEPGRVKCGFITVPENRERADSRMIRIAYAQIVAEARLEDEDGEGDEAAEEDAPEPREDPIVYLTGGPGVGMASYVERFLSHDLTKSRDLYILNQRGIGESGEVCPYYDATSRERDSGLTMADQERQATERRTACFAAATERGVDMSAYNTVENARDVRALRRALGLDSWNVWGISYGSHLGQMLVQVDPDGIRSLVLDAIVPNDLGDLMRIHRWVDRDFGLIFAECERQGAKVCDGLEEDLYAAYDSLMADPLIIPALDEELQPSGEVRIPAAIVAFAPFSMMYEQDEHPAIPAVMRALVRIAENRDEELLKALTADGGGGGIMGLSQGMGAAIRCNDGYAAAQAEIAAEDLAENPRLAGGVWTLEGSQASADACVAAGLAPRDRSDYGLVESDIPTLIINGDWDPITPPPLAERIAPGFSNGRLIIVPYAGHGPTRSMSECSGQVLTDFFDDPAQDLAALDATCFEEGPEPPKFLSYLETDATLRIAGLAADDPRNLAAPMGSAVLFVLTLLIGLVVIVSGFIARRFSRVGPDAIAAGPVLPRGLAAGTALVSLVGVGLVAAGGAAAFEISEISLLAGLAPPAGIGSTFAMLGGLLGAAVIVLTALQRLKGPLRLGTLIGLTLVGLSAVALAIWLISWGLAPW